MAKTGENGVLSRLSGKVTQEPLSVLFVASESAPYAMVAGLAMVVESLSTSMSRLGMDVRVFIPKFGFINEEKYKMKLVYEGLQVPTGDEQTPFLTCNVKMHKSQAGVTTYLLENMEYYEKRANVYGYSDDPTRWALLSRGALEFLKNIENSTDPDTRRFLPDVIQCNDWHTGILPNYLAVNYKDDPRLSGISTLFTIHNLRYQGVFDPKNISELDFDDGKSDIAPFFSEKLSKQNFMKRGILYSDIVNTVSPNYSKEIMHPEYGDGLDKLLTEVRSKVYGVLNGIDYKSYDPATDRLIEKNFDQFSLDNRKVNKAAVQKEFGLSTSESIPLIGFVGRLDFQKGIDLIVSAMYPLIKEFGVQFVQVGGGDTDIVGMFRELRDRYPSSVGLHSMPNFVLPRLLFAGCDIILYPSRFEPCGIVPLEAMRYGAVPIVRKVGGLADSVENFDAKTMRGTGFVFEDFDLISFYGQLVRAVEIYSHKSTWRQIQKNGMKQDFSWGRSAKEYVKLYDKAIQFHADVKNTDGYNPYMVSISE